MGADPIACAALAGGADVKAFFVRKEAKAHGLARRIEGPLLDPADRCMLVEDVVTTGGSTIRALEAMRDEGHEVCGVLAICDRLAGGAEAIEEAGRRAVRGADDDRRGLSRAARPLASQHRPVNSRPDRLPPGQLPPGQLPIERFLVERGEFAMWDTVNSARSAVEASSDCCRAESTLPRRQPDAGPPALS